MAQRCDVCIVGGGVMGLFLALELLALGVDRVMLIEKRFCGAGSSGKSGAICRQHYSNEVTAGLARDSLGVFSTFAQRYGSDGGFVRTGCLFLAPPEHRQTMEKNVELQRSWGINTRMIDLDRCLDLEPNLDLADRPAACFEPEAGVCDPLVVLASLESRCRAVGAELLTGERVSILRVRDGRSVGVSLESGLEIDSDTVVNCAGPWAAALAATAGVTLPIRATKPQIAFTRRPIGFGRPDSGHATICDLVNSYYCRPFLPGLTLIGGLDMEDDPPVPDPDDEGEGIDDGMVRVLNERIAQRMPIMQRSRSMGGMGALYAVTPDFHPIIGPQPECAGLYTCAGFSGHGFKMSPQIGRELAHRIVNGRYDRHDLAIFRPERFDEQQPVRGRYEYSILG